MMHIVEAPPCIECGDPSVDGFPDIHEPNGTAYLCSRHVGCVQTGADDWCEVTRTSRRHAPRPASMPSRCALFLRALPFLIAEAWKGTR